MRGDRGAGSVLVVGVLAAVLAAAIALAPLYGAIVARPRVAGAADAAALAAADVAIGLDPGIPCLVAVRVAEANGASLDACEVDDAVVTVRAVARVSGLLVTATATAGPPGAG